MNYSHSTPLYEMLRKVKKQLEKRETVDGYKQGMMFQVSQYLTMGPVSFLFLILRILDLKVNSFSIQEFRLNLVLLPLNFFLVINFIKC